MSIAVPVQQPKPVPPPRKHHGPYYGSRSHSGDLRLSAACAKAIAAQLPPPHSRCQSAFCTCDCHRAA